MKLRFRITKVGRKWIYGYLGVENGIFNVSGKIQKCIFPMQHAPKINDLFVYHNTTGKIGKKVKV